MERHADKVGKVILERCWNEKRQAFAAGVDTDDMDASVLLMPELGLLDAADPRFVCTVAAIEKDLVHGRHVLRYAAPDDFGLPETEFLVCRFWLIDALCLLGRRDEARERFDDALALRNHYGLFAEDIHPRTGEAVGQFPPDLFHGGADPQRHAAFAKLGGALLARIFIISNRVAMPQSGVHAGGLEVVLKATLKNHPCVWLGWSGEIKPIPRPAPSTRAATALSSPISPRRISRNITMASPTACCGRSCITASISRNFRAAT